MQPMIIMGQFGLFILFFINTRRHNNASVFIPVKNMKVIVSTGKAEMRLIPNSMVSHTRILSWTSSHFHLETILFLTRICCLSMRELAFFVFLSGLFKLTQPYLLCFHTCEDILQLQNCTQYISLTNHWCKKNYELEQSALLYNTN